PMRRPLRLRGVIARDESLPAVACRKSPELALPRGALSRVIHFFPRAKNLPAVRRPGWMVIVPGGRQPPDRFSGHAHHKDAATLPRGTKRGPFAMGGEGRLSIVLLAILSQVANLPAA